jgi:hypothetical protein
MMDDRTAIAKDVLLTLLSWGVEEDFDGTTLQAVKYTDSLITELANTQPTKITSKNNPDPLDALLNIKHHELVPLTKGYQGQPVNSENIVVPAPSGGVQPPSHHTGAPMPRWRKMDDPPNGYYLVLCMALAEARPSPAHYNGGEWFWGAAFGTGSRIARPEYFRWLDLNGFVPTT